MVIDANSGAVLHNQAGDEPRYPASLTKMMTLYMTFELIELGRLSPTSAIKMTEEAAAVAPSKLELDAGAEISLQDAIKALITKSANDVAVALAQHIAGSEANFARLMTKKARELGMPKTTFKNASGLPDPDQVTTARDMLTLALRLRDDFPSQFKLFATRSFTYAGHTYLNHNGLLMRYRGTDGIKTGYTRLSGFNLVTSVERDGKRLVGAVFGGRTAGRRNALMQSLLNQALAKASTKVTRKPAAVAHAPPPMRANPPPPALAAAAVAPSPPQRPPAIAAPEATGTTSQAISVARVRNVLIGPGLRRRPAPNDETERAAPAFAVADTGAPPALAAPREPAPAPDGELPRFAPAGLPQSAAPPPSTLQAQADALAQEAPRSAPPAVTGANTERKVRQAAREAQGLFEIQIGAFSDAGEAERNIASARQRANGLLDRYAAVAVPAQKGASQIYRARFKGFEAAAAASACSELKRLQIDCFVVKTE